MGSIHSVWRSYDALMFVWTGDFTSIRAALNFKKELEKLGLKVKIEQNREEEEDE